MKKSFVSNKNNILLVVVILICIFVGTGIANKQEGVWSRYSINSTSPTGYSILYETFQRLGMKVSSTSVPIEQLDADTCQIIASSYRFDEEEHLDWIEQGGVLFNIHAGDDDSIELYNYEWEKGKIIEVYGGDLLTNAALAEDTEYGYEFYKTIAQYAEGKKIVFNEYYMQDEYKPSWWDVIPIPIKLMVIQLGLCLILYIWYAGKRFGKPMDLVEEVEREENEYLLAVARLYKKAGAWELALKSYYKELERKLYRLTSKEEDFLVVWEEEELPDQALAQKVADYMKRIQSRNKIGRKQAKEILGTMEYLIQVIEKRREEYWKL